MRDASEPEGTRGEEDIRQRARAQFGAHAESYVASRVHARGWSLGRLVELLEPGADWLVLDVATGGGHTALTFAPRVAGVVALDLTAAILQAARRHITSQGVANVSFAQAEAGTLPFGDQTFDLVTCRIAAHHFPDVDRFMREVARLLRPGGWAAITDLITPAGQSAAAYLNAFERLRDPSHHLEYSLDEWLILFSEVGLEVTHHESRPFFQDLDEWAERTSVSDENRLRLRVMLLQAPAGAREELAVRQVGSRLEFSRHEAIIVGRRPVA